MITRVFLAHPRSVDESYWQHARFAAGFSLKLCTAAVCALVHALIPAAFDKTASRIVAELHEETRSRGR